MDLDQTKTAGELQPHANESYCNADQQDSSLKTELPPKQEIQGNLGKAGRPLPFLQQTRKSNQQLLGDPINGTTQSPRILEVLLETEATLSEDVIRFIGLQDLVRVCGKLKIRALELVRYGVVLRGSFHAVDVVHSHLMDLIRQSTESTAFKLAFSSTICTALDSKSSTDREEIFVSRSEFHSIAGSSESSRKHHIRLSSGSAEDVSPNEEGKKMKLYSETHLCHPPLVHQIELTKVTWTIASLTAKDKLQSIEKNFEVEIRPRTFDLDDVTRMVVLIHGKSQSSVDHAHAAFVDITDKVAKDLDVAHVPLEDGRDLNWLQEINLAEHKIILAVENGNCCVLTGLKDDVKKAKRKIKLCADNQALRSVSESTGVRCFNLQTGRSVAIKQGNIGEEKVDIIVTLTDSKLVPRTGVGKAIALAGGRSIATECKRIIQTKGKLVDGEIVCTRPGKLRCRVLVHTTISDVEKEKKQDVLNKACYNSLKTADTEKGATVVFPAVSAGLLGTATDVCTRSLLDGVERFYKDYPQTSVTEVRFIDADAEVVKAYEQEAYRRYSALIDLGQSSHFPPSLSHMAKTEFGPPVLETGTSTEAGPGEACTECYCTECYLRTTNWTHLQCGHRLCQSCINPRLQQSRCSSCTRTAKGDQPEGGTMKLETRLGALKGHTDVDTLVITYYIPAGKQTIDHPNPGKSHKGTYKVAYLPDSEEGRQLAQLLTKAFKAGITFTVGKSTVTGEENTVVWNGLSHKTAALGEGYGYPDPNYLQRLRLELRDRGIE